MADAPKDDWEIDVRFIYNKTALSQQVESNGKDYSRSIDTAPQLNDYSLQLTKVALDFIVIIQMGKYLWIHFKIDYVDEKYAA